MSSGLSTIINPIGPDTKNNSGDCNNAHRRAQPSNAPERARSSNRRNADAEPRQNRQSRNMSDNRSASHVDESPTPPAPVPAGNVVEGSAGGRPPVGRTPSTGNARRTAANHLLNFQYQPPSSSASSRAGSAGRGANQASNRRRPAGGTSRPQKYDRNKFLQANYRFLVSDGVEEQLYHADADRMFDWEDVLQVELLSSGPVQCPISLDSPPVCPQITPCGHIFAFPAIMQHLVFHGGERLSRWAPCPLCFEPVVARDLRMVLITPVPTPKVGSELTFQLLRRGRTSIMPQLVGLPPATPPSAPGKQCAADTSGGGTGALPARGSSKPGSACVSASSTAPGADGRELQGGSATAAVHPLAVNKFVKFAVVGSQQAIVIWQQVAEQLACYAAEVTSEGGLDAATLAPFVFMSLDSLAIRARKWAQRRSQLLLDRSDPVSLVVGGAGHTSRVAGAAGATGAAAGIDPQADGQAAEAAVKQMFIAAVKSVAQHVDEAGQAQPQADTPTDFPSLPANKPGKPSQSPPGAGAADGSPGEEEDGFTFPEAAFSDVDECDPSDAPTPRHSTANVDGQGQQPGSSATDDTAAPAALDGLDSPSAAAAAAETLLGSSPTTLALSSNASGDYHMYQSVDGQWIFLDPLCVRALMSHYGTFELCPAIVTAQLVELERIEQNEATRKRWKFVSHLPLTGAFHLAEVDLTKLLPPSALAPFAEELKARGKRRRRRAQQQQRDAAAEAAAARQAARRGPSQSELAAMPALGSEAGGASPAVAALAAGQGQTRADVEALMAARELGFATAEELAESIALQASLDGTGLGSSPTPAGVSFAKIAKMGFAATGPTLGGGAKPSAASSGPAGPAVGSSPPVGGAGYTPPALQGAWAKPAASAKPANSRTAGSSSRQAGQASGSAGQGTQMLHSLMQTHLGFTISPAAQPGAAASAAAAAAAAGSSGSAAAAAAAGSSGSAARAGGGGGGGGGASWSGAVAVVAGSNPASSPAPSPANAQAQGKKGNKKGTLLFTSGGVARRY